jgi:hypothetical protein
MHPLLVIAIPLVLVIVGMVLNSIGPLPLGVALKISN